MRRTARENAKEPCFLDWTWTDEIPRNIALPVGDGCHTTEPRIARSEIAAFRDAELDELKRASR